MDNKKGLNIFCTKEEIDSIQLIRNKIDCASQACRPDAIPDGISFGEWSEEMDLVGTMMFDFTDKPELITWIQFRVFFHSTRWSDPDRFLITDIQEN